MSGYNKRIKYYDNGQKYCEIEYHDGIRHGKYIEYWNNGITNIDGNYVNGKKHGEQLKYNPDGSLVYKENYIDGENHGKKITYHNNGKICSIENFNRGKMEGKCKAYRKDGSIISIHRFHNNKQHGKCIDFGKNGEINFQINYENGEVIAPINTKDEALELGYQILRDEQFDTEPIFIHTTNTLEKVKIKAVPDEGILSIYLKDDKKYNVKLGFCRFKEKHYGRFKVHNYVFSRENSIRIGSSECIGYPLSIAIILFEAI